jgi:hypothetical protein
LTASNSNTTIDEDEDENEETAASSSSAAGDGSGGWPSGFPDVSLFESWHEKDDDDELVTSF